VPSVKRVLIVLTVVLVGLVTAVGVFGQLRRAHREAAQKAAVQGDQFCVRHGRVDSGQTDVPGIGYVAVWLTGTSSAETAIQQFWAKTTWVPTGDAAWFTRLAVVGESTR
jgi:hypothetical protein